MVEPTNRQAMPKIWLASLALLALTAYANGQTSETTPLAEPSEGPAIWTLSDEDTTIHLFGYTQVLKPGTDWQSDAYKAAFSDADVLILESDGTSPEAQAAAQQKIQEIGLYTDGRTLSTVLSEDMAAEINTVTTSLGAPLQALDALKPWLASIQIGVLNLSQQGYNLSQPVSVGIAAEARSAGKPVKTLESPTGLMERIAALPEAEHIGMLTHAVSQMQADPDQTERLNAAWLDGNVEGVAAELHAEGAWASDALYEVMLVQRNKEWGKTITDILDTETGTMFVAVGLGHLAGDDSLVSMLEAQGISVRRK